MGTPDAGMSRRLAVTTGVRLAVLLVAGAPSIASPAEPFRELDLIRPSRPKAAAEFTYPASKAIGSISAA